MKKLFIAALAVLCTSALFAEDAKEEATKLSTGFEGMFYSTVFTGVAKDAEGSYSAIRMRPIFNYTNGSLEAVLRLEYDATFGASNLISDEKSSENVGLGGDKNRLEVAQAYFKSKINGINGLSFIAGIAPIDYYLVYGDNVPLFGISYETDAFSFNLDYIKPFEGDYNNNSDDSTIYFADATFKFGESSIHPGVFVTQTKKESQSTASYLQINNNGTPNDPTDDYPELTTETITNPYRDSVGTIAALSANIVTGNFGCDATGAYVTGKDKVADTKTSAYAFDIAPYFKSGDFTFTGFFTLVSGDSNSSDDKTNDFLTATVDGGPTGINIWRLYIIEDGATMTTNSEVCGAGKYTNTNGYMAAGARFDGTFSAFTLMAQGAWVQAAKVSSGAKKDMGIEVDANISYELSKGTSFFIEGAFLKTGKFYGDSGTQNANYASFGANYSI